MGRGALSHRDPINPIHILSCPKPYPALSPIIHIDRAR